MTTVSSRGTIRTTSWARAWYLQAFCGKRLRVRWSAPSVALFGILIYRTRWELVPAERLI